MQPSDNNPERRNLVLISSLFIIYHLAGGYFVGGSVGLQVVNLQFENPQVIKVLLFFLLLWSAYRYWLCCDFYNTCTDPCFHEIAKGNKQLYDYIIKNGGRNSCTEEFPDIMPVSIDYWPHHRHRVNYKTVNPTGYLGLVPTKGETGKDITKEIGGVSGLWVLVNVYSKLFFKSHRVNGYIFPYLLFIIAVCLSVYRNFI